MNNYSVFFHENDLGCGNDCLSYNFHAKLQRCESNHGLFENPNIKSNKNTVKSPFQIVCIKSELRPFDILRYMI